MNERVTSTEDVQVRLADIRIVAGDFEMAHGEEDRLYADILRAIADGTLTGTAARECAALALTSADIDFARYCA